MGNCPVHGVPFKQVPAGVSKTTGKPYSAFWACPERGCREKPQGGYESFKAAAPGHSQKPTQEYWEAKDAKKNDSILLQVAFKAAIEVYCSSPDRAKLGPEDIYSSTRHFHAWLVSQSKADGSAKADDKPLFTQADVEAANANAAIDRARENMAARENMVEGIDF